MQVSECQVANAIALSNFVPGGLASFLFLRPLPDDDSSAEIILTAVSLWPLGQLTFAIIRVQSATVFCYCTRRALALGRIELTVHSIAPGTKLHVFAVAEIEKRQRHRLKLLSRR